MEELLKLAGAKHRIRDPLYGFVYLTDAERIIIDTPIFQRLRRIHQLALTKYVYPSAEHSRFVHSLGVMHCATLMLSGVYEHRQTDPYFSCNSHHVKILRFAAFLHDIGHLPFSHAVEKQWLQGLKHEHLSQFIIENYPPICEAIESVGVKPTDVALLLAKNPPSMLRLQHEVISGQLDADRADYLLRDSHCCGVKYGIYDFARYLQIFAAALADDGHFFLSIDERDLQVAESLLIARYHYNLQIPFHRTRSGYDEALKRFIKDFDEYQRPFTLDNDRIIDVDFERLCNLDDYEIMERAKEQKSKDNPWAAYILRAKHLIPIIDTSTESKKGLDIFKNFARELEHSPLQEGEDYFIQKQDVEVIKWSEKADEQMTRGGDVKSKCETSEIAEIPRGTLEKYGKIAVRSSEGKGRDTELVDIRDRSWIFRHLVSDPPVLCRVYITPERESEARRILKKLTPNGGGKP